ncbi:hypothetical protein ANANG_G00163610 [Anguilla anguilla]|uniref:GLTSCR protein conserved domain-containing protein n=1 Tax=Anguilla anguilla TaxID=7936 RepID=A0A9D3RVD0_ANGAN|nr:hypothetical protein ANANG_G00163610 [Anguilla anguilla]
MPFSMKPSKEARMLEQLRKQQGSVLRPDYGSPFCSYGDALQRLVPYHLYQGTPCSLQDYCRVDTEFESVSSQLLKRTQAMLDKYRLLLFEESKQRLGPSAEMVMIDRMFIQEEKVALSQERVLANERPDEYAAPPERVRLRPAPLVRGVQRREAGGHSEPHRHARPCCPWPRPHSCPAPSPAHYPPTKFVIKQGGRGFCVLVHELRPTPAVRQGSAGQAPALSSAPLPPPPPPGGAGRGWGRGEDEDALPQRSSRPP